MPFSILAKLALASFAVYALFRPKQKTSALDFRATKITPTKTENPCENLRYDSIREFQNDFLTGAIPQECGQWLIDNGRVRGLGPPGSGGIVSDVTGAITPDRFVQGVEIGASAIAGPEAGLAIEAGYQGAKKA